MSLQDEMLEQNSMYQHVMQENETLKEERRANQQTISDLAKRCMALEKLVSDYQVLMAEIAVHVQVGARRVNRIDALMQRAKELIGEEQSQ